MDEDTKKVYLQNIEDYVYDENKIITYKWLSKNLSLHINSCKMLMTDFLRAKKKKCPEEKFSTTYYVYGVSKDKSFTSAIVNEKDIAKFRENLDNVISEHIYSIQKGDCSIELNALQMVESVDSSCIGIIKNEAICPIKENDLENLKRNAYPKTIKTNTVEQTLKKNVESKEKPKTGAAGMLFFKKETNLINEEKKEVAKKSPSKTSPEKNKKNEQTNKSKKAGIANFFSKQENKPQVVKPVQPKEEPKIESKKNEVKEDEKKTAKVEVKKENIEKKSEKNDRKDKNGSKDKNESKDKNKSKYKNENKDKNESKDKNATNVKNKSVESNKASKNEGVKSNGKLSTQKSNKKKEPTKKRKRIQCIDSDESDDEGSDKDDIFAASSPEPMETEPLSEEDIIPQTPQPVEKTKTILNSRKRKKIVDRTYMENGYILTKKEEVFESCSDSDDAEQKENEARSNKKVVAKFEDKKVKKVEEESPKKGKKAEEKSPKKGASESKKAKKKASPPSQGKQSSLMNFFKKENK